MLEQTQVVMRMMMMTRWRQCNGAGLLLLSQPWMSQSVPDAVLSKFCGLKARVVGSEGTLQQLLLKA